MRAPFIALVILATVHCASCFFPLFFPGPIIYPKTTTEAPTTAAPPPPPPAHKVVVHSYKPKHSYSPYNPYRAHHSYKHHTVEYDESYPVEEYEEEVTEPPTTTTTTTTTTPKPTTKKPHYYRLVYPKPPSLFFPHTPYLHHSPGHYSHPPAYSNPHYGHYKPYVARKAVKTYVPEPEDEGPPQEMMEGPPPKMMEGPPPKMREGPPQKMKKQPPTPPSMDSNSMESMESGETNKMPVKPPYRPVYDSGPRRRPPPGQPYPDQYQTPKLRRPPPIYKGGPPRRPNLYQRPVSRPPSPPPADSIPQDEVAAMEMFEPEPPVLASTSRPYLVPPKTRRPAVLYVTPSPAPATTPAPAPPPYPKNLYMPYMPGDDDYRDDNFAHPEIMSISPLPQVSKANRRVDALPKGRGALEPPIRLDGSDYEHWNRRDSISNPQLEPASFDTLSFNFIREMIANSTMSSIAQKNV